MQGFRGEGRRTSQLIVMHRHQLRHCVRQLLWPLISFCGGLSRSKNRALIENKAYFSRGLTSFNAFGRSVVSDLLALNEGFWTLGRLCKSSSGYSVQGPGLVATSGMSQCVTGGLRMLRKALHTQKQNNKHKHTHTQLNPKPYTILRTFTAE